MDGPSHYREAEKLLAVARNAERGSATDRSLLGEAQVHATLALTAAYVSPTMDWRAVLAEPASEG